MKVIIFICAFFLLPLISIAQKDPNTTIAALNKKFQSINSYRANIAMLFDVPSINLSNLKGKVIYKKPNKFRILAKGIFVLPKQNPAQNINSLLADTKSYTAVNTGVEKINGVNCSVITIIPLKDMNDIAVAKLWVDETNILILKTQVTTKTSGTIESFSTYGKYAQYGLPDKIQIQIDIQKFKLPKMMTLEGVKKQKAKPSSGKGTITLQFSDYKLNAVIKEKEFVEEVK